MEGIECLMLTDRVALNLRPGESLVGIEILDARNVLGKGELPDRRGQSAVPGGVMHR